MVEALVYIVVMVMIVGAISYFVVTAFTVYRTTLLAARADRVGTSIMTELLRETRVGESVDYGSSSFDVAAGVISLDVVGGLTNSFALSGETLFFNEGASDPVAISPGSISVTRFLITSANTPVSQAVRYDLGISYTINGALETRYYQGAAVLRQSYE